MFRRRAVIAAGLAAAVLGVLAGPAPAEPFPPAPNCENGQQPPGGD